MQTIKSNFYTFEADGDYEIKDLMKAIKSPDVKSWEIENRPWISQPICKIEYIGSLGKIQATIHNAGFPYIAEDVNYSSTYVNRHDR